MTIISKSISRNIKNEIAEFYKIKLAKNVKLEIFMNPLRLSFQIGLIRKRISGLVAACATLLHQGNTTIRSVWGRLHTGSSPAIRTRP